MLRIGSPIPHRKSRIEIIPLIDIMFFLLAAFMMVSLQMSRTENIAVELPPVLGAQADYQPDMINIAVDRVGRIFFEKREVEPVELSAVLSERLRTETDLPVSISGDLATQHGHMARVYRLVRSVGVQNIAFCVAATGGGASPAEAP